jgi:hypothetical protein
MRTDWYMQHFIGASVFLETFGKQLSCAPALIWSGPISPSGVMH